MEGPKTNFLEVECECGAKQKVFSNAASVVKCTACGNVLAEPRGGKAVIKGKIVKKL